jgi:crotonobetainyl-CoA:carnitine CoA-transferase CaiB-like acyl-CoA transferase
LARGGLFPDWQFAKPDRIGPRPECALSGVPREGRLAQHRRANQSNWERIAEVLGHPEWRDDPHFATNSDRMANLDALVEKMNAVLGTRSKAEWIEAFDAAGVPVGAVHSIGEALSHPQTLARGMVVDLVHPEAGATKAVGCGAFFCDADRDHATGAAARRTHAHTAARIRLQRCRDRWIHRQRGGQGCGMKRTARRRREVYKYFGKK